MNPEYKNLTKIPYFRRAVLQNFPFIEEDFDALTDYGLLCKVVEYLNKVIEQQNLVNDNTDALHQAYTTLKNFVDNYFDNLDVQEEINKKLEEMIDSGELQTILNESILPLVNSEIEEIKDDINNLNNILSETMDLSPKGAYATVSDLETANPSTGIYIVTSNGHIYSWIHNGTATDLGSYQNAINNTITNILNSKDLMNVSLGANEYSFIPNVVNKVIQGNGTEIDSNIRLTTINKYRLDKNDTINIYHGYQASAGVFDSDDNFLGYYHANGSTDPLYVKNILLVSDIYSQYELADSFKIILKKSDNSDILLTDRVNMQFIIERFKNYVYYGKSLESNEYITDKWINGIFAANGNINENSGRMLTNEFIDLRYFERINSVDGVEFGIAVYDSNYRWLGYLRNATGTISTGPTYWTSLDVSSLDKERKYKLYARNIDLTDINPLTAYSNIIIKFNAPDVLIPYIQVINSGLQFENQNNSGNSIWSDYNGRLAFGMDTTNAPVPTINKQQLINYGTLITMKGGNGVDTKYNRWGLHQIECYDKTNYNRITLLTDKHQEDGRKNAELYYYTGANHSNASYGNFKIGSDVKNHSFNFNRDEFTARGVINAKSIINLARINQNTDLIRTYNNYPEADAAYEPDQAATSENNAKCCLYIQLINAENGAMFYDSVRHKVVVKINGEWHDMNTTPVPSGTYDF